LGTSNFALDYGDTVDANVSSLRIMYSESLKTSIENRLLRVLFLALKQEKMKKIIVCFSMLVFTNQMYGQLRNKS